MNVQKSISDRRTAEDVRLPGAGPQPQETTINLSAYGRLLYTHIRTIGIFTAAAVLLAMVYLHVATRKYTVTMQVTPVTTNSNSLQSSLSSLSGLASMAGMSLPSSPGEKQLQLYLSALESPGVGRAIVQNVQVSKVLFKDSWDPVQNRWREPDSLLTPVKNFVKIIIGFDVLPWHPPAAQDVMEVVKKHVTVEYKPTSPIVTITFDDKDPVFAQKFLLALHLAADGELRLHAMQRATAYIAYLNHQLEHVTSAEEREALIKTLTDQEELRMAAGADISYSVDVFSPPTPSARPTSPVPIVVIILALLGGGLAGAIYVLVRNGHSPADKSGSNVGN